MLERELSDAKKTHKIELEDARNRLLILEDFCKTVTTTERQQYNVIFLGPRASGKSSIASLWCDIERLISTHSPTPTFDTYTYDDIEIRHEDFYDHNISLSRQKIIKQGIKIYDYAGEDSQISNAIQTIAESKNCSIVFVFNSEPGFEHENRRYFSRTLIEKINKQFNDSKFEASSVKHVYIVFNKIDLFVVNNKYDESLDVIKEKFIDNVANIESIFGLEVDFFVTSAETNHNTLNLLQRIINRYKSK